MVRATMVRLCAAAVGLAAATAVVLIPGHGQHPQAVPSPATSVPEWRVDATPSISPEVAKKLAEGGKPTYDPLPPDGERFESKGIYLVRPDSSAEVSVGVDDAIDAVHEYGPVDRSKRPTRAELMLATDGDFGGSTDVSSFKNRLAWVVTFGGMRADLHGPSSLSDETRQQMIDAMVCENTGIVDAADRKVLAYFQTCDWRDEVEPAG